MTITSYATLVDAITDRMNDSALSTYAPEFIQMAEAMFNRRLYNKDAEGTATLALTSSTTTISLPTDYSALRALHLDAHGPISQLGPVDFQTRYADDSRAEPANFAIMGGVIHLGPMPDGDYTATMTYVRKLTGLSASDTTNWLLESHPDLYLYASLVEAEARGIAEANPVAREARGIPGQPAGAIEEARRRTAEQRRARQRRQQSGSPGYQLSRRPSRWSAGRW